MRRAVARVKHGDRLVGRDPGRVPRLQRHGGQPRRRVPRDQAGMLVHARRTSPGATARTSSHWHDRHMLMYGGGGVAYENFLDAKRPRDLTKDHTAYAGSLFSVGLAIYDPFEGLRKDAKTDAFIADMLNVGDDLAGRLQLLLDKLPFRDGAEAPAEGRDTV